MMKICQLLTFLLVAQLGLAQTAGSINTPLGGYVMQSISPKAPENVNGTPYLNDDFMEGIVKIEGDKEVDAMLRYNIFQDNIEVKNNNSINAMSKDPSISFLIAGKSIKRVNYEGGFKYMVELYNNGSVKVFENIVKKYTPASPAANSYDSGTPAKYSEKTETLVSFKDGIVQELESSNKKVIAQFPDHNSELKAYASKNKLKLKKIEDFKELAKYYNTL